MFHFGVSKFVKSSLINTIAKVERVPITLRIQRKKANSSKTENADPETYQYPSGFCAPISPANGDSRKTVVDADLAGDVVVKAAADPTRAQDRKAAVFMVNVCTFVFWKRNSEKAVPGYRVNLQLSRLAATRL
jgi:hypothetical protein